VLRGRLLHVKHFEVGKIGEGYAARHLEKMGYSVLERNFKRPWGELDIVARKSGEWVFIEVKTLRAMTSDQALRQARGLRPEDQMSYHKLSRYRKAILLYLREKKIPRDATWRADVIAVEVDAAGHLFDLRHIEGIALE